MLRKLMIAPYFGGLPPWYEKYLANTNLLKPYGWDFLTFPDEEEFKRLVKARLGVDISHVQLSKCRKITDFFPMFGAIFENHLEGYHYWGHCGLDQVYGFLPHFVPDEELEQYPIWSDDYGMICGPFTLYRNNDSIGTLFMKEPDWREVISSKVYHAYDEIGFTHLVKIVGTLVKYNHFQGSNKPGAKLTFDDGRLYEGSQEIMMFHFNKTHEWPL